MIFRVKVGGALVPIKMGDEFEWPHPRGGGLWRCRAIGLKAGKRGARVYGLVLQRDGVDVSGQCYARWFWARIRQVFPVSDKQKKGAA